MSDLTYDFFHPRVVRTHQLSPTLLRVVLGGADLARVVSGGHDQRFKLFLPHPGQPAPVLPDVLDSDWYGRWRALDPAVRGIMRTYTISGVRQDPPQVDVDFALHGDLGPASRWAARARPGDGVSILAPVAEDNGGVEFEPPAGTGWVLLTADETALPALANILAALPAGLPVRAFVEVGHPDDRVPLPTEADAEITWLVGDASGTEGSPMALDALRGTQLPDAQRTYAWIAGESAMVKQLRRHLVGERGIDRRRVTFVGYWRRGMSEEQLRTNVT